MTDKDIVKALECCRKDDNNTCYSCPLYKTKYCVAVLQKETLNLINRLKAENERLQEQVNLWQEEAGSVGCANEWLKARLRESMKKQIRLFLCELVDAFGFYNAVKIVDIANYLSNVYLDDSVEKEIQAIEEEERVVYSVKTELCKRHVEIGELKKELKTAKSEAIKEYIEKLKSKAYLSDGVTGFQEMVVDVRDIDETYDEMVGEG